MNKIFWINEHTFFIQNVSEKGIVNIGCFTENGNRISNPEKFNDWLLRKVTMFEIFLNEFENQEELKNILAKNKYFEY